MIKKIQIALAVIVGVLIITNPSISRFNEFAPSYFNNSEYKIREELITSRVSTYFIFSIYEVSAVTFKRNNYWKQTVKFYGVLGNFYFIDSREIKMRNHFTE